MLINRIEELDFLEELRIEKKPKLLIVCGRRRVGKTALLTKLAEKHDMLYLLARQESLKDQLKKISSETANFLNDDFLKLNPFQNYDAMFSYLNKKEVPVIFDEFPFLVESNSSLPSILQEHWDKYFNKKQTFIILCGSSIRMMESLLGYKSPLYGRRTEQLFVNPLKFKDACLFFPKLNAEEKVSVYAILGGIPAYVLEFDQTKTVTENIKEKILQKNKFLYQDVEFVLKEELNEPRTYYSILKSIANGNTKIGNIMNDTGLEKGTITKYLSILQSIHLIERRITITEKNPEKSRKGIYLLKDNYFKFWFKFIFPNKEYIEQERQDKLLKEIIEPQLNSFIGTVFEDVAMQWIKEQKQYNNYLFGRWWDKNEEIDILGIDKPHNKIIACEVKWSELNKKDVIKEIEKLKEKTQKFNNDMEIKHALIAKSITNKEQLRKEGYLTFDLKDMV